jgi:hypothetical protein
MVSLLTIAPRNGARNVAELVLEFAAIGDVEAGGLSSLVKEEWLRQ